MTSKKFITQVLLGTSLLTFTLNARAFELNSRLVNVGGPAQYVATEIRNYLDNNQIHVPLDSNLFSQVTSITFGTLNYRNERIGAAGKIELDFNQPVIFTGPIITLPMYGTIELNGNLSLTGKTDDLYQFNVGKSRQSSLTIENEYGVNYTQLYNDSTLNIDAKIDLTLKGVNNNGYGDDIDGGIVNIQGQKKVTFLSSLGKEEAYSLSAINISNQGGVTFNDNVFAKEINLQNPANGLVGIVTFANDAGFVGHIKTKSDNVGRINFVGNGDVGSIGEQNKKLQELSFANPNNGSRRLAGDIYVGRASFDQGKFELMRNIKVESSNISINNSNFAVGDKSLIFDGTNGNITMEGNIQFDINQNGSVIFQNATLDTSKLASISSNAPQLIQFINITGNAPNVQQLGGNLPQQQQAQQQQQGGNNLSALQQLQQRVAQIRAQRLQQQQQAQQQQQQAQQQQQQAQQQQQQAQQQQAQAQQPQAQVQQQHQVQVARQSSIPTAVNNTIIAIETKDLVANHIQTLHNHESSIAQLHDITASKNIVDAEAAHKFKEVFATASLEQKVNLIHHEDVIKHHHEKSRNESAAIISVATDRINKLNSEINLGNGSNIAVAAGESSEDPKNGFWMNGFSGNSTNKQNETIKTNFSGGAIGYERFINENTAGGIALALIRSNSKYASHSKAESNTLIGSVYAVTNINNIILSGSAFAGQGQAKTKNDYNSATTQGKFKNKLYGVQGSIGYQIVKQQHLITPTVGMQYVSFSQSKYTETGEKSLAREIGARNGRMLIGTAGIKYGYAITKNELLIIPAIQVTVSKDLSLNASDVKSKFIWQDQAYNFKGDNTKQTHLYISPSLSIKKDLFDVSLSYTLDKAKKTTGHMGSLKIMAKF